MVKQVPDKDGDLIDTVASPINMSETPLIYKSASPELSEHSDKILKNNLGYSIKKISELKKSKIIS